MIMGANPRRVKFRTNSGDLVSFVTNPRKKRRNQKAKRPVTQQQFDLILRKLPELYPTAADLDATLYRLSPSEVEKMIRTVSNPRKRRTYEFSNPSRWAVRWDSGKFSQPFPTRAKAEKVLRSFGSHGSIVSVNPSAFRNPSESAEQAAELYEDFHGKPSREYITADEPHMPRGDYVKLGDLVGLTIKPHGGGQVQVLQWFKGSYDIENYGAKLLPLTKAPMLVSSTEGKLYFVGGEQDLDSDDLEEFGGGPELGEARVIRYRTRKAADDLELIDYVHTFGEDSGVHPKVLYDTQAKRLLLEGGNYKIEAPGIID